MSPRKSQAAQLIESANNFQIWLAARQQPILRLIQDTHTIGDEWDEIDYWQQRLSPHTREMEK